MIVRYARNSMAGDKVDLFVFDAGSTYYYVLFAGFKSSESGIGPKDVIIKWARNKKIVWNLSKFKNQKIKPLQMREAIWRIFTAIQLDEF